MKLRDIFPFAYGREPPPPKKLKPQGGTLAPGESASFMLENLVTDPAGLRV